MKIRYAVTFEFPMRPPMTHRGTAEAAKVHTCVSRAIQDAQKALRPQSWASMNCVVLERLDSEPEVEDETAENSPVVLA